MVACAQEDADTDVQEHSIRRSGGMTKKRTMGVPALGKGHIDWKKMESRGSMGKYDMFEAGRKQARSLSAKYKKTHKRKSHTWTM